MHSEVTEGMMTFPVFKRTGIILDTDSLRSNRRKCRKALCTFLAPDHAAADWATSPGSPPSHLSRRLVHQDETIPHAAAA